VLDVAGGAGDLATQLALRHGVPATTIDPRERKLSKRQRLAQQRAAAAAEAAVAGGAVAGTAAEAAAAWAATEAASGAAAAADAGHGLARHVVGYFNEAFARGEHRELLENCSLVRPESECLKVNA